MSRSWPSELSCETTLSPSDKDREKQRDGDKERRSERREGVRQKRGEGGKEEGSE